MKTTTRRQIAGGAALALLLAIVATVAFTATHALRPAASTAQQEPAPDGTDPSGARTDLPGLVAATGEPELAGLDAARPTPGTVVRLTGPFDDRFTWSRLRLREGSVSGDVTVTSDVSELLELQVLAGFYDRDGRLLGSRRFVHHGEIHDEAVGSLPDETRHFTVAIPARWRTATASAAVGVPVLVNE